MNKKVLLLRLTQLKKDVDALSDNQMDVDDSIVGIANPLISAAKELYEEDLSDLELIKTDTCTRQEVSAKLGQAIAVLETDYA